MKKFLWIISLAALLCTQGYDSTDLTSDVSDLTLEAILTFYDYTSDDRLLSYVREYIRKRGVRPAKPVPHHSQPFCCITFELFSHTGEKEFVQPFIDETEKRREKAVRDKDGAVIHQSTNSRGILIDYLQDYASRMAKAGYLSGDTTFFDECVEQYRIHRRILRNPETGLWSQGRGWLRDPAELSPGAWSRGHGWLIRGMVDSLRYLPPKSRWSQEMRGMLEELATDLLRYQDEDGMWHQLLHLPFHRSFAESSGTALISYNISRAMKEGYLEGAEFERAVRKAVAALEKCVTKEGIVLHACAGPGPLRSIDGFGSRLPSPDNPHGAPALIFGAIGGMLVEEGDQIRTGHNLEATADIVVSQTP